MKPIGRMMPAFALSLMLPVSVLAHTQLSASVPANEAKLDAAPEEISLTFSEDVRLTAVTIELNEERLALDIASKDPAKEFVVALPALDSGTFVVQWRALSEDTHVMTGEISFTIAE